jgi:hypothetical protein
MIGVKLLMDGAPTLRTAVHLQEESDHGSADPVFRVTVGTKRKAIRVEGTPDRVILVDP